MPGAATLARFDSGALLRVLLFIALFSLAAVPPLDPDLWWHLANGRLLLSLGSWPHTDLYSFSAVGHLWVMHEWLSDLLLYGLYQLGGLPLLVAFFSGIVTAGALCLYRLLRGGGLHPSAAVVMTLVAALAGSTAWGARPQLFNVILTGLLLLGLVLYRDGRLSAFWLAPFLWLWANLHSGFLVGAALAGLFLVGEGIDAWRVRELNQRRRLGRLAAALAAGMLLALLNPYGLETVLFPLGTLTSPLIQNNIQEWASPDFHSMVGLLLEGLLVVVLVGLATRRVRARTSEWLWLLATLYLALTSQRNVPLFVLAAAPLIAQCAQAVLDVVSARIRLPHPRPAEQAALRWTPPAIRRTAAAGILNLLLLVIVGAGMVGYRALPSLRPASETAAISAAFPVATTDVLATLPARARVFNYYDFGGYLVWRLYPLGGRVFIDGRVEVYGPTLFGDYLRVNYIADGWEKTLSAYAPTAILLPTAHPLVGLLTERGYRAIARDRVATLFLGRSDLTP